MLAAGHRTVIVAAVNPVATRVSFVAGTVFPVPRASVPVVVAIAGASIPVAVAVAVPVVVVVPVVVAIAGASIPVAIAVPVAGAILAVPRGQGVVVQAALVIESPKAPSHVLGAFALEPVDALGQLLAVHALLGPATDRLPKPATEGSITQAGRHTRVSEQAAEAGSRSKCSATVRGSVVGPN
jgi:hypothetical protein